MNAEQTEKFRAECFAAAAQCMEKMLHPSFDLKGAKVAAQAVLDCINVLDGTTPSDKAASNNALESVVLDMDATAQNAFSDIQSISKLALRSLENPATYSDLDSVAQAFEIIVSRADDAENTINACAESVGCNWIDTAQRKRWDAQRAARELAKQRG